MRKTKYPGKPAQMWPNRWLFHDRSNEPSENQIIDLLHDIRVLLLLVVLLMLGGCDDGWDPPSTLGTPPFPVGSCFETIGPIRVQSRAWTNREREGKQSYAVAAWVPIKKLKSVECETRNEAEINE